MSRIALSRRAAFVARIESISMFAAGCDAAHCVVTKQVKEGLVKLDRKKVLEERVYYYSILQR